MSDPRVPYPMDYHFVPPNLPRPNPAVLFTPDTHRRIPTSLASLKMTNIISSPSRSYPSPYSMSRHRINSKTASTHSTSYPGERHFLPSPFSKAQFATAYSTNSSILDPTRPTPITAMSYSVDRHLITGRQTIPYLPRSSARHRHVYSKVRQTSGSSQNLQDTNTTTAVIERPQSTFSYSSDQHILSVNNLPSNSQILHSMNRNFATRTQSAMGVSVPDQTVKADKNVARSDFNGKTATNRPLSSPKQPIPDSKSPHLEKTQTLTQIHTIDIYPSISTYPRTSCAVSCSDKAQYLPTGQPQRCCGVFCPVPSRASSRVHKLLSSDVPYKEDRNMCTTGLSAHNTVVAWLKDKHFPIDEGYPEPFPATSYLGKKPIVTT